MKCNIGCKKCCDSQCIALGCNNISFEENELKTLIKKYEFQQCYVRSNQEFEELEIIINELLEKLKLDQ